MENNIPSEEYKYGFHDEDVSVYNTGKGLNEETLGVPVIAIGVPTVVDAATIVYDVCQDVDKIPLDELFTGNNAVLEQAYSPMTIRFFILQAHYRSTLDFSNEALQAAERGLKRMLQAAKDVKELKVAENAPAEIAKEIAQIKENVYVALCDDLNTPIALSHLFDAVRIVNMVKDGKQAISQQDKDTLEFLLTTITTDVLGVAAEQEVDAADNGVAKVMDALVNMVLEERKAAKANKDWAKSDKIRDDLKAIGVLIKDTKDGVEWTLE